MAYTELLSQEVSIPAAGIFPVSESAGTYLTGFVDMAAVLQAEFRLDVGVISSGGTVNFQLMGCATTGGSYVAITGTAITALTQAGGNSGSSATVLITSEKLNALALGYRYVKAQVVVATAAAVLAVSIRGKDQRFDPGSAINDPTVVQQILLFR